MLRAGIMIPAGGAGSNEPRNTSSQPHAGRSVRYIHRISEAGVLERLWSRKETNKAAGESTPDGPEVALCTCLVLISSLPGLAGRIVIEYVSDHQPIEFGELV